MTGWINELAAKLLHHLLALSFSLTILTGIIQAVAGLAKQIPARVKYLLWGIVLVRCCLPAFLPLPSGPPGEWMETAAAASRKISAWAAEIKFTPGRADPVPGTGGRRPGISPPASRPGAAEQDGRLTFASTLVLIYFSTLLILGTAVVRKFKRLNRLPRRSQVIIAPEIRRLFHRLKQCLGLKKEIRLYQTAELGEPASTGLVTGYVYLPRAYVTWKPQELEPILLHELAHFKRRDNLVNLLQIILQWLYFFHPAVWFVNRKLRRLREEATDDLALQQLPGGHGPYSLTLLKVAELFSGSRTREALLGFGNNPSIIKRRIIRIMNNKHQQKTNALSLLVLIPGLLALGITCLSQPEAASPGTEPVREKRDIPQGSYSLRGTVTDADSGEPLAGAGVKLYYHENPGSYIVGTDASGRFVFNALPPGEYSMAVSGAGYPELYLSKTEKTGEQSQSISQYLVTGMEFPVKMSKVDNRLMEIFTQSFVTRSVIASNILACVIITTTDGTTYQWQN